MTSEQLDAIADAFKDLFGLLRDADPRDRAELYSRLGLRMTYQPGPETLMAEVVTPADLRVFDLCPEIDTHQYPIATDSRNRRDTSLIAARLPRE